MKQENALNRLVADLTKLYGEDLLAVILFGSAARGDHAGKSSDLNVLAVLKDLDLEFLERASGTAIRWTRQGNQPILFFTPALIEESRDVFPMEFLDIRDSHRVLAGNDFFATVDVAPGNLRLQCETELKGKTLQLRERYLLGHGKKRELRQILAGSFSSIMTICRGVLRLAGEAKRVANEEVIRSVCRRFDLAEGPFHRVLALKKGGPPGSLEDIKDLYRDYYGELRKLQSQVDRLETGGSPTVD